MRQSEMKILSSVEDIGHCFLFIMCPFIDTDAECAEYEVGEFIILIDGKYRVLISSCTKGSHGSLYCFLSGYKGG